MALTTVRNQHTTDGATFVGVMNLDDVKSVDKFRGGYRYKFARRRGRLLDYFDGIVVDVSVAVNQGL